MQSTERTTESWKLDIHEWKCDSDTPRLQCYNGYRRPSLLYDHHNLTQASVFGSVGFDVPRIYHLPSHFKSENRGKSRISLINHRGLGANRLDWRLREDLGIQV